MNYKSLTIRKAIDNLNRKFFLPALQREFVWTERQIIRLFDSILRGYPISSLLFWQPSGNAATKWPSYKFLDEFRDGGTHNNFANLNGVRKPVFVLDGQQRLTALNLGLRGIYVAKEKRKWRNNPNAWRYKKLYIDLLHQNRPDEIGDDDETDIHYRIAFWEQPPPATKKSCWFEIGKILQCSSSRGLQACIRRVMRTLPKPSSRHSQRQIRGILTRVREAVFDDPAIFFYTETRPDYDRVLDIFVRANEAGTKLTKSDLLLSTITANWQHEDARKEIHDFVDYLNNSMERRNYFQKDFVMKACFVLCDLPVKYKVTSFTKANLAQIEESWPKVRVALENCVRLVNRFGIDEQTLISANALIPIAYYIFQQQGETLLGTSKWEVQNSTRIHRWLVACLLNRVFSGSSDTMLAALREVLRHHGQKGKRFPIVELNAAISKRQRSAEFTESTLDEIVNLEFGSPETFLALTLLYDDAFWGSIPHEQDHIFPRSRFDTARLAAEGLNDGEAVRFGELHNRLANLQLLVDKENRSKRAQEFEKWVKTRARSFYRKHLIPTNRKLYSLSRFEDFIEARQKLIRARLKKVFAN